MKRVKIILSVFILIFLFSCSSKKRIYVYSPNKKQCITIITHYNYRYIIEGKHYNVPDTNYIKYSLDSIDVEVADEIVGHWKNSKYEWEIATDNAIILENKLDPKKFKFNNKFPTDHRGIPTIMEYTDKNSFDIGFERGKIIHYKGAIVK